MRKNTYNYLSIIFLILLINSIIYINCEEEDYYTLLGVSRDASTKEIKKAFRTLSLKYHPDRNPGNKKAHELYLKINKAHEVLTNPELKEIYDIYGEEGLNQQENMENEKERGPNARIDVSVDLEDLYNGATRIIEFEKNVICKKCHGTGGKLGKTKKCPVCKGRGSALQNIEMFGMTMQMEQECERCGGRGIIFSEVCPHCRGRKIMRENKKLTLEIEKGMENGQKIVFKGESEQSPDTIPGDLIITLKQNKHNFFKKRIRNDLYADINLSLKEALFGYNKKIKHLDGREFYIESKKITQPDEIRVITGEGMPVHKFPSQKGDLIITFRVNLPKSLNKKERELIGEIFPESI